MWPPDVKLFPDLGVNENTSRDLPRNYQYFQSELIYGKKWTARGKRKTYSYIRRWEGLREIRMVGGLQNHN